MSSQRYSLTHFNLRQFAASLGVLVILFNLLNAAPRLAVDAEFGVICTATGTAPANNNPLHQSGDECCGGLAMCCAAALPAAQGPAVAPPSAGGSVTFLAVKASLFRPAAALAGSARSPPVSV